MWSVKAELARELRLERLRAGKTPEDVRTSTIASISKLRRMENGEGPWRVGDVAELAKLYGLSAPQQELWRQMALASGANQTSKASNPAWFELYLRMEQRAIELTACPGELIHGLLQTPAYHRALQKDWHYGDAEQEAVQRQQRQDRQEVFWSRDDVCLNVIMSQSALEHRVGPRTVMNEQLERLYSLAERPGVSLRFVPSEAPPGPINLGPFTVLITEAGKSVYSEASGGGSMFSTPSNIGWYEEGIRIADPHARDVREWQ